MNATRALASLVVGLGFLSSFVDSALAQVERGETRWHVYAGNDSSSLTPRLVQSARTGTGLAIECSGNAAVFTVVVLADPDLDPPPWGRNFEGVLPGSLRLALDSGRPVEWRSTATVGIEASIFGPDVEALMLSAGAFEIEVDAPDEESFHHSFSPSESFRSLVPEFLETCRHHVRRTDLQIEVDGIKVFLEIDVDAREIEYIRALAREFGIREIEHIRIGFSGASSLSAMVYGRETESQYEITRLTLEIGNRRWRKSSVNRGDDAVVRGDWHTSSGHLHQFRRWIIEEGNWSINVAVGPDVSYDVTRRIIAAVRHERLVDSRDPNDWNTQYFKMPSPWHLDSPDADGRPYIGRAQGVFAEDEACRLGCYQVQFLSGKVIIVRLVEDIVEVRRIVLAMH